MKPTTLSKVKNYQGPHGFGVIADLRTENGRQAARGFAEVSISRDPACVEAAEVGIEAGMAYILSLGWTTAPGLFTMACNEEMLDHALDAAMTRSEEMGIGQTFWLVVPEEVRNLISASGDGGAAA
jgi:hypothetical protein